ncbi:MAG: M23 family metallopeptidase [Myxococcaceae bacterium]
MQLKFVLLIFLLVGCHHNKPRNAVKASFAGSVYEVKKGDTVHTIAKKKKISAFDLMEVNGITDSGQLRSGQRLYIPEPEPESVVHVASVSKKIKQEQVSKPAPVVDGKKIDLAWPVKNGVLFKSFETNPQRLHEGIALGAPRGTIVMAAASGEVIYVGDDEARYGRIIIINHEDPFVTIYAHLDSIDVVKGQKVKKSEPIGTVGTSGGVDSPRVYFQVRKHRTPVDPELYLKN